MAALTPAQVQAVQKSWAVVDKDLKGHGVDYFIAAHPDYQQMFKPLKDIPLEELKDHKKLKVHGSVFMHQLSSVIKNLDDLDTAAGIIEKITEAHVPRGVTNQHFVAALTVFGDYLKTTFGESLDAETGEAWAAVVAVFLQVVKGGYDAQKG